MLQLRLYDCVASRLPSLLGLCQADRPQIARYVNSAQRRLLYCAEAGDEGWWGTWAEMAFTVSLPATTTAPNLPGPYLTTPREVARLEAVQICDRPYVPQNQFYEYLQFGNGRLPKQNCCQGPLIRQIFTRNNVPTFVDINPAPQNILAAPTNAADVGKRVLIQGLDNNGNVIYSQDGLNPVLGQFVVLTLPFVKMPVMMNQITGIQKDITQGNVQIFQLDPNSGVQTLLVTMEPSEQTASYRRYYFDNLPPTCCFVAAGPNVTLPTTPQVLTITAICKLELQPVFVDTDYLLIQNLEAITDECQSIRYSEVDNPNSNVAMSRAHHQNAVRALRGELAHYLGITEPAVEWAPFGAARLERRKIGLML